MGLKNPGPVTILASSWLLISIAATAILARLYLRLTIQRRPLSRSDYIICAAWISSTVYAAFTVKFYQFGSLDPPGSAASQKLYTNPQNMQELFKLIWLSNIPLLASFYLCKAALLDIYLNVFPEFMVKRRLLLWGVIVLVAMCCLTSILLVFFICTPLQSTWDLSSNTCPKWRQDAFYSISWGLHFATDVIIFALPWLIVPSLKLQVALQAGLYAVFMLGIINISMCTIRYVVLKHAGEGGFQAFNLALLLCLLDSSTSVLIACLPSLRPYLGKRRSESTQRLNSYSEASAVR